MEKYNIVLFKNKNKKKIIKKFITEERAKYFFTNIVKKSEEVIFDVKIENGKEVNYEIGIVEVSSKSNIPTYLTDDIGRQIKVKLDEQNMVLSEIKPYKKEEKIFDLSLSKKITVGEFIKKYLKSDTLKVVSILNNKIIVQKDEKFNIFSLKNEEESVRFIDCVSLFFFKNKRTDCLFIKDSSLPQRKYLIKLLEDNGFNKKILYRKYTTYKN
jgi:predicted lipase